MAPNAEPAPAGLLGPEGNPIPLQSVRVKADIRAFASRVELTQLYRNDEGIPIEAVYIFPLPEAAALCGFTLRVGERKVAGRAMEREAAFAAYDDALGEGHLAGLVDQERPNVFTLSVGNVGPGQEVEVQLTYAAELAEEGGAARFLLPTVVSPRYAPPEDRAGVSPTPAERVSPPVAPDVPYRFEVEVSARFACGLRSVESPSHPIRSELSGDGARVTLALREAAMDSDFVLLLHPAETRRPWVEVETDASGGFTACLTFAPKMPEAAPTPAEVLFLVDRSGSMEGASIHEVRRALQLCLRALRPGDTFEIVGFGSQHRALFGQPAEYNDFTLGKATAHLEAMEADLGGTQILPALESVLGRRPDPGRRRQVVLLTDGQVSNDAAVTALAAHHRATARIFTFGIGHGCSEHLVNGLARVTGGRSEFITPGEALEEKVLRQFALLGRPGVSDVAVSWSGLDPDWVAPAAPPALLPGEALAVFAHFPARALGEATLSATVAGETLSWTLPVDLGGASPGCDLSLLGARKAIRELEEGRPLTAHRGSAQRERTEKRAEERVRELALRYGLASSQTSLVAVDPESDQAAPGGPVLRPIPVALTRGMRWGDSSTAMFLARGQQPREVMTNFCRASDRDYFTEIAPQFLTDRRHWKRAAPLAKKPLLSAAQEAPAGAPPSTSFLRGVFSKKPAGGGGARPHDAVAMLQRAEGSWQLNGDLAKAVGLPLRDLKRLADELGGENSGAIVATLAALAFLEVKAADCAPEWKLLAEKAERWLQAQGRGEALAAPRETLADRLAGG